MKKSFIILLLLLINQWVFAQEDVDYIIREDGVYCGSREDYRFLEGADPATFVIEIPTIPYAKDRNNVYWNGEILPDANAATFRRIMNTDYGTDGKGVYFGSEKLFGADPGSFNVLKPDLAADKHFIYSKASVLDSLRANFSYYANFVISGDNVFENYTDLDAETLEIIKSKKHRATDRYEGYVERMEVAAHEYFNIYFDDINHRNRYNLRYAHMETLKILGNYHAKDSFLVLFIFDEIYRADPKTFEVLSGFIGKDKRAVYSGQDEIFYADPNSFEMISQRYGKDGTDVFFDDSRLPDADLKTFTPINEHYAKDKNKVFFKFTPIAGSDPCSFSASEYLYPYSMDKHAVYYKAETIENADPASFVLLYNGYSKDKYSVFLYTSIIPEADPETFKRIVGTDYSTDREHVFYDGKKLENSDGLSFRVLDDDYCLDKNNVYYYGEITGADPATFKVASNKYGYPSYPGSEKELKNFVVSRLNFSKYPCKTDSRYTAHCRIDTSGKVYRVIMNYKDKNSEWENEIARVLYSMPDWQFPIETIKDSAHISIPFIFKPSNQTIDPDEEYAYNEIFMVQIYYPEFPGGFSNLDRFFTRSLKYPKLDVKDQLTGDVICRFKVNRDGTVVDAHVVKSLGAPYDNEVLRIINSQPKWKPGKASGLPASGMCEVTVFFSGYEVQKQKIKRVEFIKLYVPALGGSFVYPAEKGYERMSKKYRRLNDMTIEFDN